MCITTCTVAVLCQLINNYNYKGQVKRKYDGLKLHSMSYKEFKIMINTVYSYPFLNTLYMNNS